MDDLLILRAPSVGGLVKKMLEINPELGTGELIEIIRNSTQRLGGARNDFAQAERIDDARALELARQTLQSGESR